jgi:hypothetical protein
MPHRDYAGHGAAVGLTGAVSDAATPEAPSRQRLPSLSIERACFAGGGSDGVQSGVQIERN